MTSEIDRRETISVKSMCLYRLTLVDGRGVEVDVFRWDVNHCVYFAVIRGLHKANFQFHRNNHRNGCDLHELRSDP